MPKERRDRSVSIDRPRASPYHCSTSHPRKSPNKNPLESEENLKEWEDARCPVCMEHPHNAILLLCSSHDKGCHPYMCDTSYRHSNCFDQFRKSFSDIKSSPPPTAVTITEPESPTLIREVNTTPENEEMSKLVCPLCRGRVNGWVVVDAARVFMNTKSRSCASETCEFLGTYTDLRKHARLVHPLARPSEADPERQRDWRRLERQRDLGDLLSTLQSSIGEDQNEENNNSTRSLSFDEGGWLTVFFLIRVFRPGSGSRTSSWSGSSRARAQVTVRRRLRTTRLWGESYDGESREEDVESSDGGSVSGSGSGSGSLNVFQLSRRRRPTPDNDES